ncbi:MAG TPA: ATP-binding protein [Thermomicrobiales bacterium]|jgi:signal transduction histidine kinase
MSAIEFIQWLTQALYVLISIVVTITAVRHPTRVRMDIALFFGVVTVIIAQGWVFRALGIPVGRVISVLIIALLMLLPYLLLRLVNDFTSVPTRILRAAEAGLACTIVATIVFPPPLPLPVTLLLVIYFFVVNGYVAFAFLRAARRTSGVTRRRMQAVAYGSGFLGLSILLAGFNAIEPAAIRDALRLVQQLCSLASGISYFIGFAPPSLLRRAWQEPELRAFLGRAASLPRLPDTAAIVRELERGAVEALGAPYASIGLWDEASGKMFYTGPNGPAPYDPDILIGGRAFTTQQAVFSADAARDDPEHAALYRSTRALAILAAPITAGTKRLGVLSVFAPRAPIFAEEDLRLVQLLADQGAVILESRALIDEAARVRAREEATRLKDDFLSAAAHDLKTPLTTLIASAQLLERRALRRPEAPPDLVAIRRIVGESIRLRGIVVELLDAARAEQGQLLGRRESADLVEVAREVAERHTSARHQVVLEAHGPIVGLYDTLRITQLLDNLVENAVKYSPAGGDVTLRLWVTGETAHMTVTDQGIGVPPADLPHLFDRFHRAANVDDRSFAGMGLGLYICRGIVEEHGGRIAVSSTLGAGSTFEITLPHAAQGPRERNGEGR